jgi:hypothetical protein
MQHLPESQNRTPLFDAHTMKKGTLLILLIFSSFGIYSQNLFYPAGPLQARSNEAVVQWLQERLPLPLGWSYCLEHTSTTPTAHYRLFGIYNRGVPAVGLQANVCTQRDGRVVSAAMPWRNRAELLPTEAKIFTPSASTGEAVYYFDESQQSWAPAYRTRERLTTPDHRWWERFHHAETGVLLSEQDLLVHFAQDADTTVSGLVFNPDPLTQAGVAYGGIYTDLNDGNGAVLNPLRVNKNFRASFSGGVFSLSSPAVVIQDFDPPTVAPAVSSTPQFSFSRSDDGFEDVNAFYHIQTLKNHTTALGFSAVPYAIPVDPHAINGQDNSFFDYGTTPPRLYFGEGGVDDAEDADVVVHEYGHAISQAIVPNTNFGDERRALDEAFGDYWAVSYSRHLNAFGWQKVFGWDGHNEFWSGRSAVNTTQKLYPGLTFNNIYAHTQVWVDALMRSWPHVGRDEMDALVLEAAHQWTSGMTFRGAAELVLQADTLRNNGTHAARLHRDFGTWLILQPKAGMNDSPALPSPVWATQTGMGVSEDATVTWFDSVGRVVLTKRLAPGNYDGPSLGVLPAGVYTVHWVTDHVSGHFTWMNRP